MTATFPINDAIRIRIKTNLSVEIIAKINNHSPMDGFTNPIAIAHMQGLKTGKSAGTTPLDCPWSIHDYEACLAWFAGYSIGILAMHTEQHVVYQTALPCADEEVF